MLSGPDLDAPDVPGAKRGERVVHEIPDRGERRGDEVGVFVRIQPGQVDEGRAARVGQVHMLDNTVEGMREPGHGARVGVPRLIPSRAIIWRDSGDQGEIRLASAVLASSNKEK